MTQKQTKVKPQLLKGFRDYPPSEQLAKERMLAKVREVFERMGFLPLQTASLEFAETLLGPHYSQDSLNELFGFTGPDEVNMALRYEFTLSLARYVASNPNLALPFRRYQYGNVWRVDKPGPGRFREFMQFDIDIVGTPNILADAEIIAAMVTTFEHLQITDFEVRYSDRKILNGLIEWAGIPSVRGPEVMRVLDKFERQGEEAVVRELGEGRTDQSGDKILGLQLPANQIDKIVEFIHQALKSTKGSELDWAERNLGDTGIGAEGIKELRLIEKILNDLSIVPDRARLDLTIVRGLGYYTGPVFETTLKKLPQFGSVFSGGRYDNLVDRFSNRSLPAVGSSIGIDRLLAALIELKALELEEATSKVLVTVMDEEKLPYYLGLLKTLRKAGINAEIFCGETKNLTKQIKYADKVGIPLAVIVGSDEFEQGLVTIKDLRAGREKAQLTSDREEWLKAEQIQKTIPAGELIQFVKETLKP